MGTPSGLDYHNHRFLVATRDWLFQGDLYNHVLDIDARSGRIDQYFQRSGDTNQLNDILYDPATQSILLGYQSGSSGFIQRGPYPGLWAGRHGLAVGIEGGEAVLSLHGLEWRAAYRIHASADLHAWQPIHSLTGPPIGGQAEFRVPIHPHPARFFKLDGP